MSCYIIASNKNWHIQQFNELKQEVVADWHFINDPESLTSGSLQALNPDFIFFPHWSHMIHSEIYSRFSCIVFHMTDLPYGRGGSPLQNLIVRGHKETKISAIKVTGEIDAGDVYLKKDLALNGNAKEIFDRAAAIIKEMIIDIIHKKPIPSPQAGTPVFFKRRTPQESNVKDISDVSVLYDYIRMLDADGYPQAFIETGNFRFEFSHADLKNDNTLTADVRIIKK